MALSIRKRMALGFIFIIVLTVVVLEILIINSVRANYYANLEASLRNQLEVSCELYDRYFSDASLKDNVLNNVDTFWKQANAQVQIIDTNGVVLMDSIGYMPDAGERLPDVEAAIKTGKGTWIGRVPYDKSEVMAVSRVLKANGAVVGVLRFISTMEGVNKDVRAASAMFTGIGLIVAAMSALLSFILSNTIVNPLKNVTLVAERMASGDFRARSGKIYNDEIGKLSDTLNYLAEEINKRDKIKNDFISSISHELRTPLTSIKGWAVTLAETGQDDRELFETGLGIIEKECDRLTAMVEELLDFSRLVSGKLSIRKEKVPLEEFIDTVGRQLLPRAEKEGIHFGVETEGALPVIMTDGNRLKQVIINILDNAFRFTQAGGNVQFRAAASGGEVIFSISDTGCGIPPEEMPYIKEKFFRGKNSKSGSGIGLAICDELIRLMGGSLSIYSVVSRGTEVVIRLPVSTGMDDG